MMNHYLTTHNMNRTQIPFILGGGPRFRVPW